MPRKSRKPIAKPSVWARLRPRIFAAAVRAGGVSLALVGGALVAALLTFSISDPSWNTATGRPPTNILGFPGAVVADVSQQAFGVVAYLIALPMVVWGVLGALRSSPARTPAKAWVRFVLFPFAIAALAGLSATLPPPLDWPFAAGVGGALGDAVKDATAGALAAEFGAPAGLAAVGVVGAFGFVGYLWVCGAELDHLRAAQTGGRVLTKRGARAGDGVLERIAGFFARLDPRDLFARFSAKAEESAPARSRRKEPVVEAAEEDLDDVDFEDEDAPARRAKITRTKPGKDAGPAKRRPARQATLPLGSGKYELPALNLLAAPTAEHRVEVSDEALEENARMLEGVLADFGVRGEIIDVRPGPVVTLYELEPAAGVKSSRVIGLADDIARSMSAVACRVAVVPGRNVIGIELPNDNREMVFLRELLDSKAYDKSKSALTLALGKDIGGEPVVADLARMPHLLIAGTTGSGKSVGINTMILSLLYRLPPDKAKLILIDPKMLELSVYDGIPHLLAPVVTDPSKAVVALKWTVREMEERYRKMSKVGVRNISGFNERIEQAEKKGETLSRTVHTGYDDETGEPVYESEELDYEPMPFIVVVIDEMADLMMVAGKDIEGAVQRLAQMARAAGIHVVMATQRPSVDVITGTIKANFPTRISFHVTSKIDSRTILGEQGAEQLLGQGDMLYMATGGRLKRVHGAFVSDDEVEDIVNHLKKQGKPEYIQDVTEMSEDGGGEVWGEGNGSSGDDLYDRAVAVVLRDRKVSTSYVQRRLSIGYNRAATLIERMEQEGVISPANHAGKREILVGDAAE
ncbi:MAG: DNA translocase FtsK 4TM domain-containing protein [Pseudomonadota bacterium]